MIRLLLACCLLLPACADYARIDYAERIPPERAEEAAAWIERVCASVNPMSDEEPEDWIKQAERTARAIFGVKTIGMWIGSRSRGTIFVPYWDLPEYGQELCDKWRVDV